MTKQVKIRSLLIGLVFSLLFIALIGRVYWIQVVEASWLQSEAEVRWKASEVLRAKRGMIMDRNGKPLAEDSAAYNVTVNPQIINERGIAREVAGGLAKLLNASEKEGSLTKLEEKIYGLVTKKNSKGTAYLQEVEIRNEGYRVDADKKEELEAFIEEMKKLTDKNSVGIYLRETQKRYYPNNRLASHILGYIDLEGEAKGGIEVMFNEQLMGQDGDITRKRDRTGVELPDGKVSYTPPLNGKNLRLTIDQNIQFYTESAMRSAYDKWKPENMTAIAVDPKTMEILAMASLPDFNPNRYWEIDSQKDLINHAISSQFEPGSTFKLVTLAGAIEEGMFNPNDWFKSGTLSVPGNPVHDHNRVGWGTITYLEGLLRSSNVLFAKLGYEKLQKEKLQQYIDVFGFGAKTGIELPNEVSGGIQMKYPSDIARVTFGQGTITATALQQTAAYAAIANRGILMKPILVKEIVDPVSGEVVESFGPQEIGRVVSEETALKTGELLEQTVSNKAMGSGRNAYIEGYPVAGKTGTANIVPEGQHKYSTDTWLISFVGYAPLDDPQILITVLVNQPNLKGDYRLGGEVATTVFKEIATQTLHYLNVPANSTATSNAGGASSQIVPNVIGRSEADAKSTMGLAGLQVEVLGSGGTVIKQFPEAGSEISPSQNVYLAMKDVKGLPVPDLTGKSAREAMEICTFLEASCTFKGQGYVVSQSAGDSGGKSVNLELKPLNPRADVEEENEEQEEQEENKEDADAAKDQDSSADRNSSGVGGDDEKDDKKSDQERQSESDEDREKDNSKEQKNDPDPGTKPPAKKD
ncbi:penicillin-binding transpeptidase domain-containing protein [Paenibacillus sp. J2TS4]|uniref:penicillin-binding transpeptidase domain-containing protein n=1 Tax=Paenibacillus sp. J2TS4 TaxID=2807194 RepID=UPI001B25E9B9|nr:penicillin-binding transpeptidase domain-containing protein [Paenibacillus sp. J2TS4]GIP36385.1 penicillin-binding protein 2B [Paenibacillus sp. J2TS4]